MDRQIKRFYQSMFQNKGEFISCVWNKPWFDITYSANTFYGRFTYGVGLRVSG